MSAKVQILKRLVGTEITEKSKTILGQIVRKEFDQTKDEDKAFELLNIAFRWKLPEFAGMIDDYELSDFKWF